MTTQKAISLMESGRISQIKTVITHKYVGLKQGPETLEMAAKTRDQDGKLVVKLVLKTSNEDLFQPQSEH